MYHQAASRADIANSESYAGEEFATCLACAGMATPAFRPQERVHRLAARDPGTPARAARKRAMAGLQPRGPALVETWALCDRCIAYLKDHLVVRFKADGRMIRWLETDHGHPVAWPCALRCLPRPPRGKLRRSPHCSPR